jgi:hypothetical protein
MDMKTATMRGVVAGAALAAILAGGPNAAGDDHRHLAGSWETTITAVEPPGLPPFRGLITFTRDGEVLESRRLYVPFTPFGPILETTGHGAWERQGHRDFAVTFRFLLQAAPNNTDFPNGDDLGTDRIRMRLRTSSGGDALAGTFQSEVRDAQGNVIFTARGTVAGTRIRPEPLP